MSTSRDQLKDLLARVQPDVELLCFRQTAYVAAMAPELGLNLIATHSGVGWIFGALMEAMHDAIVLNGTRLLEPGSSRPDTLVAAAAFGERLDQSGVVTRARATAVHHYGQVKEWRDTQVAHRSGLKQRHPDPRSYPDCDALSSLVGSIEHLHDSLLRLVGESYEPHDTDAGDALSAVLGLVAGGLALRRLVREHRSNVLTDAELIARAKEIEDLRFLGLLADPAKVSKFT